MFKSKGTGNSQKALISILFISTIFFFLTTLLFAFNVGIKINNIKLGNNSNQSLDDKKSEILNTIKDNYIGDYPSDDQLQDSQLKGLVASLNDPYSEYLPKADNQKFQDDLNKRYEGVGISFKQVGSTILADEVLPLSPALDAGVKDGDVLKKVDDKSVDGLSLVDVAQKIRGPKDSVVKLQFQRGSEDLDFSITRKSIAAALITLDVKDDIGVVTITSFGDGLDENMKNIATQIIANKNIKKITIDLRDDTGGLLKEAVEVISYFLPPSQIVLQEKSKSGVSYDYSSPKDQSLKDYPLAIVVDKYSASASEIMAGALRDQRQAKLVGQTTYGKGVVQKLFYMGDGGTLKLTIAEWLTPKGSTINKTGLEPDIQVKTDQDALDVALKSGF